MHLVSFEVLDSSAINKVSDHTYFDSKGSCTFEVRVPTEDIANEEFEFKTLTSQLTPGKVHHRAIEKKRMSTFSRPSKAKKPTVPIKNETKLESKPAFMGGVKSNSHNRKIANLFQNISDAEKLLPKRYTKTNELNETITRIPVANVSLSF